LIFSTTFVRNIPHSTKNSARHYHKFTHVFILVQQLATGRGSPRIESRWEARFSATVQTGPEAHQASYTMGSGSFPRVALTTHPIPRRG
jgi:hypothetical protein